MKGVMIVYTALLGISGIIMGAGELSDDIFGGISLLIVSGFYLKSSHLYWNENPDGIAVMAISTLLLWMLGINDLIGLGVGALDDLTPPIILLPFSLPSIALIFKEVQR
ncbi:MAG TPA: hypothetical protein ENI32_01040 [Candidatus Syntrophoarchaeum butanivorans]|uniref:Membrane protein n=1 Tax=Candidatus Syntropharchaeum butanivorans TaxID=1839936 RepID=A0A1F2P4E5_9EURY|nr:MAG: membrane protein [Candidatus Syntrophoarchaeum butanivorans]HEC56463.1 hypothetical protein [Candidatus Syntrophoarchaeum butanivorans]